MGMNFTIRIKDNVYKVKVGDTSRSPVVVEVDGHTYEVEVGEVGRETPRPSSAIASASKEAPAATAAPSKQVAPAQPSAGAVRAVVAPMPGKVIRVDVRPGDSVSSEDVVCVLEAMKMEQIIKAGRDGVVAEVLAEAGQMVGYGAELVRFQE